jgi:gamma-glutamyltranspeptidase/glutathione hydrolase
MRDFHMPGRSATYATRAMAATSHPLATETALATLRAGGTAADAAVAACAVLCVVEPHMVSPAGDCFWIVKKPGRPMEGYNGSGRAAAAAGPGLMPGETGIHIGQHSIHAVTVPGAVEAWAALAERHGRLGFPRLMHRAIEVAEDGHAVTPRVAFDWANNAHVGAKDEGFAAHYLPGGRAPKQGELFRSPGLARTFKALGERGPAAMYQGEIAEEAVATLRGKGSLLTLDDFAAHRGEVVDPIVGSYRGVKVAEIPPNGQGLTALVILNVLENFDLARTDPLGAERFHLEIEATRLGYAIRDAHIAEVGAMRLSPAALADKGYASKLAAMVSPDRRMPADALPPPPPESCTVYLSVVDEGGMAVSFICSTFGTFGVGVATPRTGLIFQNRGWSFRTAADHPNAIGPGKRPMHTIIPGMVLDDAGECRMSFGVMGGAYQACGHAHVLANMIDNGMDPQAALDSPRAFIDGPLTTVERGLPPATLEGLARRGHQVIVPLGPIGGGQIVEIDRARGVLVGASDPRKDGSALGY